MGKSAQILGAFGFLFIGQLMIWIPTFEACPLAPSRSGQILLPLAFLLALVELCLWRLGTRESAITSQEDS